MAKKRIVKKVDKKLPKKMSAQWTATSRLLRNLEPEEMLELFQRLYMLSPECANLIDSQFKSECGNKLLEEYRQKIVEEFFSINWDYSLLFHALFRLNLKRYCPGG